MQSTIFIFLLMLRLNNKYEATFQDKSDDGEGGGERGE